MKPSERLAIASSMTNTLDLYARHLRSRSLARGTIRLRLDHARSILMLAPVDEIDVTMLEAWLAPTFADLAPETIKSRRSSARSLFRWLHAREFIDTDASLDLAPVRIPPTLPRVIPDPDVSRALVSASARDRAAILLARYACLRLTEIATLRTAQRLVDRLLIKGKGGRERLVYLHPRLASALDDLEWDQGSGFYFPGRFSGSIHPQSLHKVIKRATGWNPHALRHAGATAAYVATHDLRAVQLMLGHASIATTQRYLHLDEAALRRVAHAVELRRAA